MDHFPPFAYGEAVWHHTYGGGFFRVDEWAKKSDYLWSVVWFQNDGKLRKVRTMNLRKATTMVYPK